MESRKQADFDFLVAFFIKDRLVNLLLQDVLKQNRNKLIRQLGLPGDFEFPFYQETDGAVNYWFRQDASSRYRVTVNGDTCTEHAVCSGDYFTFRNAENQVVLRMLFVPAAQIRAGYRKYRLSRDTNIFIGRLPINDISYDFTDYVSREKHAAIHIDSNGDAFVEDLKRSVGVYVNGQMTHSRQLKLFDEIYLMGLSIIYLGDCIAVRGLAMQCDLPEMTAFSTKEIKQSKEKEYFTRTPRILKSVNTGEIEVDGPPSPVRPDKTPAILVLGPSATMAVVMLASVCVALANAMKGGQLSTVISSAVMAVGMLLSALMWPMLIRSYQKRKAEADENYRQERYKAYIAGIEERLIAQRDRTVRILNESLYPAPEVMCSCFDSDERRLHLWERSGEDSDFLQVRIGLGTRPFHLQLKTPKVGFQLYDDPMLKISEDLKQRYSTLNNVPLTIDLHSNHAIGMVGSPECMKKVLDEIILNLISLHSCDEVKLVVAVKPQQAEEYRWLRNVPHIWSSDMKLRFYMETQSEAYGVFSYMNEIINAQTESRKEGVVTLPHYVVVVTNPELTENQALFRYLDSEQAAPNLTVLFAYGEITVLPKCCRTIIQCDEERTGYYSKNKNANRFVPFALDSMETGMLHRFAGELSRMPIRHDARMMGIAERVTFLQMYKVGNVEELQIERRWDNNNSARSLAAPIGVMAGDKVFQLDIHEAYHGCHGLVAGTTGSGKSEFLQEFVLSLAINYSPKEVAFVLVDFKGGDMARPFMKKPFSPALPHLAATISNLSGNILYRALVSLDAEIKSRQRIFNEAAAELGVDKLDINSYHKYYKNGRLNQPLPHLVIIIDEFAQLKTQRPDFLTQLINVAQVGRSLGIHLILATQKPSGIVDPQIMSNSHFKICLKVAEKQDSMEMINRPDSAMIKNPGRMYLQVGYNEVFECVQSGYSGAEYIPASRYMPEEEITVQMTDNTASPIHSAKLDLSEEKLDKTQIEAVVEKIVELGQKKHLEAKRLWLDVLPEQLLASTLPRGKKGLCCATVGMLDLVATQEQKPFCIDFVKSGHLAVYGASMTGKTTFLLTLVHSMVCDYGYTPEEINLYAMDFGGRTLGCLGKLPHTGGVVFGGEEQRLQSLSAVLHTALGERKQLFAQRNCSTFADYRAVSKTSLPAIVVLIDNYAAFREKYMDIADEFTELIADGCTFGIFFVITGSTRNAIYYKVTEYISNYITFRMNDPSNYLDILNQRPPVIPEEIPGRGITVMGRQVVEFQTAEAFGGGTEAERMAQMIQCYQQLNTSWKGQRPVSLEATMATSVEVSPERNRAYSSGLVDTVEPVDDNKENLVVGTSLSGALSYGISLESEFKLCICADGAEALCSRWKYLLRHVVQYSGRDVIFVDDESGTYREAVTAYPSCRYIHNVAELDVLIEDLKPILNERLENPCESHRELFLVFSEFNALFAMITDEQAAFLRKVIQYIAEPVYGIRFLCGFDVNGSKLNDRLFLALVVHAENYLLDAGSAGKAAERIEALPEPLDSSTGRTCFVCQSGAVEIKG